MMSKVTPRIWTRRYKACTWETPFMPGTGWFPLLPWAYRTVHRLAHTHA